MREPHVEIIATEAFTDLRCLQPSFQIRFPTRHTQPLSTVSDAVTAFTSQTSQPVRSVLFKTDWEEQYLTSRTNQSTTLLVTEGFEDLLETANWNPSFAHVLRPQRSLPLIGKESVFGIAERISADGCIVNPLQITDLEFLISKLKLAHVKEVAICFLNSLKNNAHEKVAAEMLRAEGFDTALSCELSLRGAGGAQLGQTVAALQMLKSFWNERVVALNGLFPEATISFYTHAGTVMSSEELLQNPLAHLASTHHLQADNDVILDIGFTQSTRITHGENGRLNLGFGPHRLALHWNENRDLETQNYGFGSVIDVDSAGMLRLSPVAVNVEPGPALFGRSTKPTVFDCLVAAGHILPQEIFSYKTSYDESKLQSQIALVAKIMNAATDEIAELGSRLFADKILAELALGNPKSPAIRGTGPTFSKWMKSEAAGLGIELETLE